MCVCRERNQINDGQDRNEPTISFIVTRSSRKSRKKCYQFGPLLLFSLFVQSHSSRCPFLILFLNSWFILSKSGSNPGPSGCSDDMWSLALFDHCPSTAASAVFVVVLSRRRPPRRTRRSFSFGGSFETPPSPDVMLSMARRISCGFLSSTLTKRRHR